MRYDSSFRWVVRISWSLLGGVWGAWVGFGGYFQLPQNADSFGSLFASGFFVLLACVGFLAGAVLAVVIGGLVEGLLRRLGVGVAGAIGVATLMSAMILWQTAGFVQAKFPGLRPPAAVNPHQRSDFGGQSTTELPRRNTCSDPPPTNPAERVSWDSECR